MEIGLREAAGDAAAQAPCNRDHHVGRLLRIEQRVDRGLHEAVNPDLRVPVAPALQRRMVGKDEIGSGRRLVHEAREAHHQANAAEGIAEPDPGGQRVDRIVSVHHQDVDVPRPHRVGHLGQTAEAGGVAPLHVGPEADEAAHATAGVVQQVDRDVRGCGVVRRQLGPRRQRQARRCGEFLGQSLDRLSIDPRRLRRSLRGEAAE